ncbi:MAG: pilus assembly protein CpaD [Mameliella sp.]|nr:pilus assembly protein CpaD [Mameliella sp.]
MAGNPDTTALTRPDMIVLGGGPAGAVSAWLAAGDGLLVLMIDPCKPSCRIEGMSPRLLRWLDATGIGHGGAAIGPFPRSVDWANQPQATNTEHAVDRDRFDAHLRGAAERAGAHLLVGSAKLSGKQVTLPDGRSLTPRWIIDARGRQGRHREGEAPPFSTISICGWYRQHDARQPGFDITALPEGWLWRAALPGNRTWAQLTTDARNGASMEDRLTRAIDRAGLPPDRFTLQAPLSARASAPLLPAPITDLDRLPVGDALAAMDPLSGHGLFWAVSSALAVAAVRRTRTARPGPETDVLCRRFLAERANETYLRNARIGRDFMRMETRYRTQPFWTGRRDFPDDEPIHDTTEQFEVVESTVVRDGLLEPMDILRTPKSPAGIAWLNGIPAVEAWRMLDEGKSLNDLVSRWGHAGAALPELFAREAAEEAQAIARHPSR